MGGTAPSAEPLKPSAAGRGAAAKATALASGFTASAGGSAFSPAKAAGICAGSIVDSALGGCIPASAVPALGSLLPLSIDLNVDLAGNVGMGTSSPASRLHVVGDVRADGQLISTAASGAPLLVSSSTRVAGLNADLLDGVDASAFSQLGGSIESAEITNGTITAADLAAGAVGANALATGAVDTTRIADGTILNSDVASTAAIAGTKISPDFGAQTIRTTGQVGIGTSSPERPLHVVSGSAGAVTPQGNSIAVFERSTNGYVSILTPDGSDKGILFGNPTSNVSGGIVYDQASVGAQSMQLRTGGNVTRMTITGAGDVGLGTTAPEGLLHVQDAPAGTMTAYSNSIAVFEGSSKGFVSILGPDGTAKGLFFGRPSDNRSGGLVYDQASVGNESMQFRTGGNATRMTITQAGDVGIGTSAPTGKLHVADAAGGNGSVVLPSSSISDAEILDEPGLASAKSETLTGLTPVAQTLLSRSISVPSSGYVIATATMTVGVGAFGGGNAYYGINTDGNLASGALEYRYFSDAGAVKDAHQVTLQAVFNVNSAGTTTFFLQAQETSGNLEATNRRLILVFIPTAYGTVTLN